MNLLFWNLKQNNIDELVRNVIVENDVDVAIFSEYKSINYIDVIKRLNYKYKWHDGFSGCEKVTLLCKNDIEVKVRREHSRYTLYTLYLEENIIVGGVHLPSPPYNNSEDRKNVLRELVRDIKELESSEKHTRSIVIGDFNCNPFDQEMIQKDAMNSVLFKDLIKKSETVKCNDKMSRVEKSWKA